MKKIFLVLVLGLLFSNLSAKKKVSGYIITTNDDTIKVTFKIPMDSPISGDPDLQRLQRHVTYYDSTGTKKILEPKTVKAIVFTFERRTIKMMACIDNLGVIQPLFFGQHDYFFHVISDEKIKVLRAYKTFVVSGGGGGAGYYSHNLGGDTYVYKKGSGELFRDETPDFAKYFVDCPDVMNKINNKEYQKDYIAQIVNDYNKMCGQ
jgi:hypothetical protein